MFTSGAASQQDPEPAASARAFTPSFNWELPPAWPAFRENLRATRTAIASVPYRPGIFWRDVFVDQRLNWRGIRRSYALHILFAGLIYVASMPFYWQRLEKFESFHDVRLTYVTPNEDLVAMEPEKPVAPPKTASIVHRSAPARKAVSADARQRVAEAVAIAKWSDNRERTILAPKAPRVASSAPMPDLVVWSRTPQAPPVAAVASDAPKLVAPFLDVAAVAPPPDLSKVQNTLRPSLPQVTAIAPPVQTRNLRNLSRIDLAPTPAPITPEPKLTLDATTSVAAIENVNPVAPPPDARSLNSAAKIPATVQPVEPPPDLSKVASLASSPPPLPDATQPVQAAPDLSSAGNADLASGALVSLNVTPIAAPVVKPDGQARGTFAGRPQAPEIASATPERHAGGSGPGGDSPSAIDDLGIMAKAVPHASLNPARPLTAAVLPPGGNSSLRNSLMAMAAMPRVSLPPSPVASDGSTPNNPIDERVFHGRKYHQMELNTPNLTSRSGSWIFRFAELGTAVNSGEWSAPQPVQEVDPAYPADLMRANVQGVVVLYAIIRADGSVDAVKVLEGFDAQLDENARRALSAWHFVPGMRDGSPVDLEAVVRIPFRSKRIADLP